MILSITIPIRKAWLPKQAQTFLINFSESEDITSTEFLFVDYHMDNWVLRCIKNSLFTNVR